MDILAFHTTQLGTAEQRSRSQLRHTYRHQKELLPDLIQKLKDLYLLIDPAKDRLGRASGRLTRLAHDTLAPIIRQQFEKSDRPGQRAARILAAKIADFDKKKTKIWLDETDLNTVEAGLGGMRHLNDSEQKLLEISRNKKIRNQKIRRSIWAAGILMAMLIILSALIAIKNMNKARQQERAARINYLTILANDVFKTDSTKALRIAQAAYKLAVPDPPLYLQQLMHTIFYSQSKRPFFARAFNHKLLVSSAVFSSDASRILTGSWDKTAKLWTVAGESLAVFNHPAQVTSVAFCPDGNKILTASTDCTAKLWSATGDSLAIFRHHSQVNSAVFSPDGEKVLTASSDGTARLWSINGDSLAIFKHRDQIFSALFSPGGKKILTASKDKTARLWSLRGDSLTVFRHDDRVYAAEFSPDGKKVLTASWDKTAKLWTLDGDSLLVFNHNNQVLKALFSPDGNKILTVCLHENAAIAKLWTITGDSIGVFKHPDKVYSAVFSPDNRMILIATSDKTAKLWLTIEGIYQWLQTAPIYQLTEQEKRGHGIIE